jgi:hypothetical protein
MVKEGDVRLHVPISKELKKLAIKVARARGESLSSLVRRAVKRELALLNYLSNEEKKALGISEHRVEMQ